MNIWARKPPSELTHTHSSDPASIKYDATAEAFTAAGVWCKAEYPERRSKTRVRKMQEFSENYLHFWYGAPMLWEQRLSPSKGNVGYMECEEIRFISSERFRCMDLVLVATESLKEFHDAYIEPPVRVMPYDMKELIPLFETIYETKTLKAVFRECQEPIQLNLGCGDYRLEGWLNTDIAARQSNARLFPELTIPAYAHNIRRPLPFDDNTVSAITVSHVLSTALCASEVTDFLAGCYRVLVPGGVLRITDNNASDNFFPCSFYSTSIVMRGLLEMVGFKTRQVRAKETDYIDGSICVDLHGPEPKVYFVEGIKS
jgi:hypothetical protein